jgi:hypothetical protein
MEGRRERAGERKEESGRVTFYQHWSNREETQEREEEKEEGVLRGERVGEGGGWKEAGRRSA